MSSVLAHQERSSLCHVHHTQVIRELGKRSSLLFLSVVTANIFHFLLRERTDYIVQHSIAQCLYCQPWLSSVHFLPQPIPSTRVPTSCSSSDLSCCVLVLDFFFLSFCVCLFAFPKAFKTAPLKVTLKMSLVKMKGKFHLTFLPFDISIGLGCFVFNFSAP